MYGGCGGDDGDDDATTRSGSSVVCSVLNDAAGVVDDVDDAVAVDGVVADTALVIGNGQSSVADVAGELAVQERVQWEDARAKVS